MSENIFLENQAYCLKNLFPYKKIRFVVVVVIIIAILFTSAYPKYQHNTTIWPTSGSYTNSQEPFEYGKWFNSIPINTKVFTYAPRDKLTIGFGGDSCAWCQEVINFRKDILNKSVDETHLFLKEENYDYFLINPQMDLKYLKNQQLLQQRYDEIFASQKFVPIYRSDGDSFIVFQVN